MAFNPNPMMQAAQVTEREAMATMGYVPSWYPWAALVVGLVVGLVVCKLWYGYRTKRGQPLASSVAAPDRAKSAALRALQVRK